MQCDSDSSFEEKQYTRLYKKQLAKMKNRQHKTTSRLEQERRSPNERSRSRERMKNKEKDSQCKKLIDRPMEIKWTILQSCPNLEFEDTLDSRIRRLPIIRKKDEIIEAIIKNQFVLVTGDTGCGKSTQVPRLIFQYLHAIGDNTSKIMIVQPRRLAVTNLHGIMKGQLRRVSSKDLVGYQIGMKSFIRPENRIVFVTNGIFLQRLVHSTEFLNEFPFILLDEVHERDIDTDFILLTIKRVIRQHPKVRIVLMSATIDNELFRYYFASDHIDRLLTEENFYKRIMMQKQRLKRQSLEDEAIDYSSDDNQNQLYQKFGFQFKKSQFPCPQICVTEPGSFKRDYYYLDTLKKLLGERAEGLKWGGILFSDKYPSANKQLYEVTGVILENILYQHRKTRSYTSVLIFMPGHNEIEKICDAITRFVGGSEAPDVEIIQVYRNALNDEVSRKLNEPSYEKFKIIVATNIAQSSITVLGVKYVIDFCLAKENRFDIRSKMEDLELVWTSKASCRQRAGRTGRVCDGVVIRMVQEKFYNGLPEYSTPEIQRSSLDKLVLRIKLLHQKDSCNIFSDPGEVLGSAIQPPRLKNIDVSIKSLQFCGGLEQRNENYYLTSLGRLYVDIPIDIAYCKLLVLSKLMGTYDDILILVGVLSQSKNAIRRNMVEKLYSEYYQKMDNPQSCDFTALIKLYKTTADNKKHNPRSKNFKSIELDVYLEARDLVFDIQRRIGKKDLSIFRMNFESSLSYFNLARKIFGEDSEKQYQFRFKMTILCGFIENILKVKEASLDDRQEKRLKLMKKMGINHRNTFCILKSNAIRRQDTEEGNQNMKKNWRIKVLQATKIPNTDLTLTHGLCYLHFANEKDLQKFAFFKFMEQNRREYNPNLEAQSRSNRMTFPQLLSGFGEMDHMHAGRPVTMVREHTVFVQNQSLNRLIVMNENDKCKYLVCNNLCKTSSRMNARYTSLLPQSIPHIAILAHLLFYPFLAIFPSQDKSKYQWMQLKRNHKIQITYQLANQELHAINTVRKALRDFLSLESDRVMAIGDFLSNLLELIYLPRREVQEEDRWQQAYLNEVVEKDPMLSQIYREMKTISENQMDQEIRERGVGGERAFMNELRGCILNPNFFSGSARGGPTRDQIEESYLEWKRRKVREVQSIEMTAQNHDTYLACGQASCGIKICKLKRVGPISQEIFRDLITPERQNLKKLPFNEEDCHFCSLLMSNYIDSEYETVGCADGHYLAIQIKGEHNYKILPFSQLLVIYPDGTPVKAEFDRLDERFWKKTHQEYLQEKLRKRLSTYCFVCDQVLQSFKDLEFHMKEERHAASLSQFKKNLAKPEQVRLNRMQADDSDGY